MLDVIISQDRGKYLEPSLAINALLASSLIANLHHVEVSSLLFLVGGYVFTQQQEVRDEGSGLDNVAPRLDVDVCFREADAQDGPEAVDGDEAHDAHDSKCVSTSSR